MDEIERKINMRKRADIREREKEKNFKRTSMKKIRRHEETNRKTERTERTPRKRIQLGKKPGDGKREDVN
jgi:hypothetical protein